MLRRNYLLTLLRNYILVALLIFGWALHFEFIELAP